LIQPFIENLRSAKDGEFVNYAHVKPKRIVFQDVTNELCVKNVFVKRLLHEQSQMVDDPEELLSGLIEEMGNKE
jgi:predicted type IV restriction endonuclease